MKIYLGKYLGKVKLLIRNNPMVFIAIAAILMGTIIFSPLGFRGTYSRLGELPKIEGLKIGVVKQGTGEPTDGRGTYFINYRGLLPDSTEFAPKTSFQFKFGDGTVLKVWEDSVLGMRIGEIRRVEIDPKLAYGDTGVPGVVPPNSKVIFEIELVRISN